MSVALVINGVTYDYPEVDDTDWGAEATDWAAAVTSGMLQKAGGLFQLLADVDFGTSYGVKALYYKSRSSNVAAAGQIRLARTDNIAFRNVANNADLNLTIDGSNNLTFNGNVLGVALNPIDTESIDLTSTGGDLSADLNLSADAATAGSALATLTIETDGLKAEMPYATALVDGSLSSADWSTFDGKQDAGNYITSLTGNVTASGPGAAAATIASDVITNAMVNSSAAIAYSKLNLAGGVVNADVSASAAIAFSKLASLTSAHILVGSAGNVATDVAVTGDIGIDNAGVTSISSGVIVNADVNASAAIAYSKLNLSGGIVNADVNASAAIAYSKLNLATSIVNADIAAGAAIVDTKLATISTASKVSNSATTATTANTANAIVTRGASGEFTAGAITAASVTFSSTTGIVGTTTNNSAAAGSVGEYSTATTNPSPGVSCTSNTPTDICSISLTAGDWDVWGTIAFVTTTSDMSRIAGGLSTTSASMPTAYAGGYAQLTYTPSAGTNNADYLPVGAMRFSLASTTTVYLVGLVIYTTGSPKGGGSIQARRVR